MLDAGFAPLSVLKSRLLPSAGAGKLTWDEKLKGLGRAVAGRFERHCGRTFARAEGWKDVFDASASAWVLTRYPVETVTSVSVRSGDGSLSPLEGWRIDAPAGLLEIDSIPAGRGAKLEAVYTGGYWLDPCDGTTAPEGAKPLPDDVFDAWVLQCQVSAEARGLFVEVAIRPKKDEEKPTGGIRLCPEAEEALRPYRRFGAA